jgi:hypothetical protein
MNILNAVGYVRRMRGGSQPHMLTVSDGHDYIVKFLGNPQGNRVLANELLATRLAQSIGLPVPIPAIVEVPDELIQKHRLLRFDLGRNTRAPEPGLQFGSRVISSAYDFHPEPQSCVNHQAFAGMLAFDKWTSQMDGRQAVYFRRGQEWFTTFIDFGYAFGANKWEFLDVPWRGLSFNRDVYKWSRNWDSFQPWLSRIEDLSMDVIQQAAKDIPAAWYDGDQTELNILLEQLVQRRGQVRNLIGGLATQSFKIFDNWCQDEFH